MERIPTNVGEFTASPLKKIPGPIVNRSESLSSSLTFFIRDVGGKCDLGI
jgi:hypothetical protein